MPNITDNKIKEFISLFDGDISAVREALSQYENRYQATNSSNIQKPRQYTEEIISVRNLYKQYKHSKQTVDALRDVSLSIRKGEFVAITGASGSGKSTLLHMIGCLDKPSSGSVAVEGKETTRLGDGALSELRRNSIGFIFQSFYLQPFLRLDDNLTVPAMFTNEKRSQINSRVQQLLLQVGLSESASRYPRALSGGQIQRAAIARALVNNPHMILADEPTGNLDSKNSESIIELFRTIRDKLGTTIVVVTHDMAIARQADRIIELRDGEIV